MAYGLQRGAGILLPIFSLPSPYGAGTLGQEAKAFVDFLAEAGQRYWQVLPVGPTGYGDSPYQTLSLLAGNPYLIDLSQLMEEGLLQRQEAESLAWGEDPARVDYGKLYENRWTLLRQAASRFRPGGALREEWEAFRRENAGWLPDFCLYMALKVQEGGAPWTEWPRPLRFREPEALEQARNQWREEIHLQEFCQFQFFRQWRSLRAYAGSRGIRLIGDMPIYAALDSADVWSRPECFQLNEERRPRAAAGVPPDAFTELGQLWGNPLYDWERMEEDGFSWWRRRMSLAARLFDVVRIDHFIGLVRYYSVPAEAEDARGGAYFPGPGRKLTAALEEAAGSTAIVAEDLGVFLPEVRALLEETGYPNMKVLEFAFAGGPDNGHLPHHYQSNCLVYGGTHDNETLAGFLEDQTDEALAYMKAYLGVSDRTELPGALLRAAYASVAEVAVFQVQDLLGLGKEARMNFPGRPQGNWQWRLLPGQLTEELGKKLRELSWVYGRL